MNNRILDNLHGLIYLTDLEWDIVKTPQFQRLRHIKQLGVADLVFPGAQHTRFSHSLGVLHLTEKVFWNIKRANEGLYKELKLDNHRFKLRLAALLHDIGHYPLSHTLESAYRSYASYNEKKEKDENEKEFSFDSKGSYTPSKKDMHHEHIGKWVIENSSEIKNKLLESYDESDIFDITDAIIGNLSAGHRFYSHILHSDIDVDTLDYCLRDSRAAGIEYGKYDINFLMDNVRLTIDSQTGIPILCFDSKAIHTIEHFLLAKHYYYLQIIFHPKRWFFEEAAKLFAVDAIEIGWLPSPQKYRELIIQPEAGYGLTDHFFWSLLYRAYRKENVHTENGIVEPTEEMAVLAKILIERRLPETFECSERRIDCYMGDKNTVIKKKTRTSFKFIDHVFKKDKYLESVFGVFSSPFKVTRTIQQYMEDYKKELRKDDKPEDIEKILLRDPIRIISKEDVSVEFLSEMNNTLAYSLAKQEIQVNVDFIDEY